MKHALARFANPHRDFLDIGSHIGYYAVYLSPCVRRVYAFEPDARNLPYLRRNALAAGNVEVAEVAVSSRDGMMYLYGGGSSATSSLENVGGPATPIQAVTIDAFADARPDFDVGLVKIDVEGHDLEALRGMRRMIVRSQPLILSECSLGPGLAEFCSELKYSTYAFVRDRSTLATQFRQLVPQDTSLWTKMVFLVPECHKTAFDQLSVQLNGSRIAVA